MSLAVFDFFFSRLTLDASSATHWNIKIKSSFGVRGCWSMFLSLSRVPRLCIFEASESAYRTGCLPDEHASMNFCTQSRVSVPKRGGRVCSFLDSRGSYSTKFVWASREKDGGREFETKTETISLDGQRVVRWIGGVRSPHGTACCR